MDQPQDDELLSRSQRATNVRLRETHCNMSAHSSTSASRKGETMRMNVNAYPILLYKYFGWEERRGRLSRLSSRSNAETLITASRRRADYNVVHHGSKWFPTSAATNESPIKIEIPRQQAAEIERERERERVFLGTATLKCKS